MRHTPWAKASSLPSERLRTQPSYAQTNVKGKGKRPEEPKSQAVLKLESQLAALRASTGRTKDPKGGCFCLGLSSILVS